MEKKAIMNKKSKDYCQAEESIKANWPVWKVKSMTYGFTNEQIGRIPWLKHIDKLDENKTINEQLDLIAQFESGKGG
jgi:hypothetical protein